MMNEFEKTISLFLKAVNHYRTFEADPVDFGNGELLYPSEIHFIEFVGNHPYCSLTLAAEEMEISKGAVSQLVKKLVRKGFLRRTSQQKGGNQAGLFLPEKGKTAYERHRAFHQSYNKALLDHFGEIYDEDLAKVNRFLERFLEFNPPESEA